MTDFNKIIIQQLKKYGLEYEIDIDVDWNNEEVIFCDETELNPENIFAACSDQELTLLFTTLIEQQPLHWPMAWEIARLLPEKGYLIKDKFSLEACVSNPFSGFNQMLLAYLGSSQEYETEIIRLLDEIPEDARDGLFLACEKLNTPAICRKLMEKFTQWITADPTYGNGTGELANLEKFMALWQETQDPDTVGAFSAFCREKLR